MATKTKTAAKPAAAERTTYGSRFAVKRAAERMYPDGAYEIVKVGDRFDFRSKPADQPTTDADPAASDEVAPAFLRTGAAEPVDQPAPTIAAAQPAPGADAPTEKKERTVKPADAEPADDKANVKPERGGNVAAWDAAEAGRLPDLIEIPESNAPVRKHLQAMREKAAAGDRKALAAHLIGGSNSYAKMARNYRGALLRYLDVTSAA